MVSWFRYYEFSIFSYNCTFHTFILFLCRIDTLLKKPIERKHCWTNTLFYGLRQVLANFNGVFSLLPVLGILFDVRHLPENDRSQLLPEDV